MLHGSLSVSIRCLLVLYLLSVPFSFTATDSWKRILFLQSEETHPLTNRREYRNRIVIVGNDYS